MNAAAIAEYSYLIIDDDKLSRDLIAGVLRKQGVSRIAIADGGKAAADHIKAGGLPDIVICDLNMPEFNGIEFLHYLADSSFNGGIMLVSGTNSVIMNAAKKLGNARALDMLGVLPKPFMPDDLIRPLSMYEKNSRIAVS